MKQLMENWRRYISLNEGIDPRIQKILDRVLKTDGLGVAIGADPSFGIKFQYIRVWGEEEDEFDIIDGQIKSNTYPEGAVEIYEAEEYNDGPCYEGYIIMATLVDRGWGPLLYEVALEYASERGGGLTADRGIVSDMALSVWDKYAKRGDVDIKQMDVWHDGAGNKASQKDYQQLTPEKPADDCDQHKAISMAGPDWSDTSVSKMYYKPSADVIQVLKAAGRFRQL